MKILLLTMKIINEVESFIKRDLKLEFPLNEVLLSIKNKILINVSDILSILLLFLFTMLLDRKPQQQVSVVAQNLDFAAVQLTFSFSGIEAADVIRKP